MKKRGLSGIVATLLLILIAVIAISLIWNFVRPVIVDVIGDKSKQGDVSRFADCIDLNTEVSECDNLENGIYNVRVSRGADNAELKEIRFIFNTENEEFILTNEDAIPSYIVGELGSITYQFNLSEITLEDVLKVDVAGILVGGEICGLSGTPVICTQEVVQGAECGNGILEGEEECDDGNLDNGDGCSSSCQLEGEMQSCSDQGIIIVPLSDFDEETCTRTRNGYLDGRIKPLPPIGFHSIGPSVAERTSEIGANYHRLLISWHKAYNESGDFKKDVFDSMYDVYVDNNMGILLTIKSNDPNRSTCSYEVGERSIDERDSYPKNETEWTNYVKSLVSEYYVKPILEGNKPLFVGIQLGNEWSHQFVVNTTDNPECDSDKVDQLVKKEMMVNLTRLTYEAIQEAQESINYGEKMPMVTVGITGGSQYALKRGFNLQGIMYTGHYDGGVKNVTAEDVNEINVQNAESFLIDSAPYYDYIDIHARTNYYDDHGYIAQWVRNLWAENGITGKGLLSDEYAGPFHFYTTEYHEYFSSASISNSFHQGYDSIAWAPWYPPKQLRINFGMMGMTDWNGDERDYAVRGYQKIANQSKGFVKVKRIGGMYEFYDNLNNLIGEINISEDIPEIPDTFEQCSDGLDNDNDGLVDGNDSECGIGNYRTDVEFVEEGIYF